MTDARTLTFPAAWHADACVLWARRRRVEAVQSVFAVLNAQTPKSPRLVEQAAFYLFLLGDFPAAASILRLQLQSTPADLALHQHLAVILARQGVWAEAVDHAQAVLAADPAHFGACDVLAHCLPRLGREREAAEAGTRSLLIKDGLAGSAPADWVLPPATPARFAAGKRRIVSFSLWGSAPAYLRGALRNLLLAPDLLPGWTLRFAVDDSVPAPFLALIEELGGELRHHPADQDLRTRLCRRFLVAGDATVGHFLVRDADSVFSLREALAIDVWLASDHWFHVLRDGWTHTDLMLAGLWGGVAGVLPDLAGELAAYVPPAQETPNIDQWFLRDRVWRYVRSSCLVHDRCFTPPGALPPPGPPAAAGHHIGQNEFAAHRHRQERQLAAWIARHPCLGSLLHATSPA